MGHVGLGLLRPRERPFVFRPGDERIDVADLEPHPRLFLPAVVDAFEEMVKETLLPRPPVVRVEVDPMLQAVNLQPLLRRGCPDESLDVAPQVEAVAAPVAGGQQRHRDLLPDRGALPVKRIVERMGQRVGHHVGPVLCQLVVGERLGAGDQEPVVRVGGAASTEPMLHRHDLLLEPVAPKVAQDPAVSRHVAIEIGRALPRADGGQVGRLQRGHVPLVDRIVGDAVETDLAVAPGLPAGPLDAVVQVLRLARRERVDIAGRAARPPRVDTDTRVPVRHPLLRIDHLPILVLVRRAGGHVRVLPGHDLPLAAVSHLEREAFAVRAIREEDGIAALLDRAEDVGPQHDAVIHGDGHLPIDAHVVRDDTLLAHLLAHLVLPIRLCSGPTRALIPMPTSPVLSSLDLAPRAFAQQPVSVVYCIPITAEITSPTVRCRMVARIRPIEDTQVSHQMRQYFALAEERGAPNATLLRILARDPWSLQTFYDAWNRSFYQGKLDHLLKELMRVRMARLRGCAY